MRIKGIDKIQKGRSFQYLPLQFEILYNVWSSKGWCTDTGKILGPFFVVKQFIALDIHEFYSYAQYSVILHIRRCYRAGPCESYPGRICFGLPKTPCRKLAARLGRISNSPLTTPYVLVFPARRAKRCS